MAANDNVMTRFLFAILRQKNLKDIDWNKVAHDPILAQEITNGHAARMRYSRFKSAMLGLEPQRRNRTPKDKNRITKSKKDPKGKEKDGPRQASTTEADGVSDRPEAPSPHAPKIKQEGGMRNNFESRLTPGPMSVAPPPPQHQPMPHAIQPRLLTPGSETNDAFGPPQAMNVHTSPDMFHPQAQFDFPDPHYGYGPPNPWAAHGAMFPPIEVPHEYDAYGMPCGHEHHMHHPHPGSMFPPHPMGLPPHPDMERAHGHVKHEHWDGRCP